MVFVYTYFKVSIVYLNNLTRLPPFSNTLPCPLIRQREPVLQNSGQCSSQLMLLVLHCPHMFWVIRHVYNIVQNWLRIHQPFLSSRLDLDSSHVFRKPSYYLRMSIEICIILQMQQLCAHTQFEYCSFIHLDVVKVG